MLRQAQIISYLRPRTQSNKIHKLRRQSVVLGQICGSHDDDCLVRSIVT